jgi:hypothetical protein
VPLGRHDYPLRIFQSQDSGAKQIEDDPAKGSFDDIANTGMEKRRGIRWPRKEAHRVAVTMAATLDDRLTVAIRKRTA